MVNALILFYARVREEDDKPPYKIRIYVYKTIALRRRWYLPITLTTSCRGGSVYTSRRVEDPKAQL